MNQSFSSVWIFLTMISFSLFSLDSKGILLSSKGDYWDLIDFLEKEDFGELEPEEIPSWII